eukprot:m51a1_g1028 putative centrosomal protein of 76 kda (719) ;mRNA; f:660303-663841
MEGSQLSATERIERLKRLVRDQLRSDGLSSQIRQTLQDLLAQGHVSPASTDDEIVRALQSRGAIEGVVRLMAATAASAAPAGPAAGSRAPREAPGACPGPQGAGAAVQSPRAGQHVLCLRLLRGKAFLLSDTSLPIVRALQSRGAIEGVVRLMAATAASAAPAGPAAGSRAPREAPGACPGPQGAGAAVQSPRAGQHVLCLRLLRGKAFLLSDTSLPAEAGFEPPQLVVDVHFQGQRVRSVPVASCAEPPFCDTFVLEISRCRTRALVDAVGSLPLGQVNSPLHFVVTRQYIDGTTELVGTQTVEWRRALRGGGVSQSVEVVGAARVPVGLIDVRLEVVPALDADALWSDDELSAQLSRERAARSEAAQSFYVYAKQWWAEYRRIGEHCAARSAVLLAQSESGEELPVCCFVAPVRAPYLVESPAKAARFVSLLPVVRGDSVGRSVESWSSLHTLLARGKGTTALLLGFGLDAYVCVGSPGNSSQTDAGRHAWVLERRDDGSAVFWESTTACRYTYPVTHKKAPRYQSVDCAFNNAALYANVQDAEATSFALEDPRLWKQLPAAALSQGWPVPIQQSTLEAVSLSSCLDGALRELVAQHRQGIGLMTVWDEDLGHRLSSALWSYEMERLVGTPVCSGDFEQSIKRAVPDGHTFKGFPISFSHRSPMKMLTALLKSPVGSDVVRTRGDKVRMALCVQCHVYPEDAVATWLMIAVRYVSV